MTFKEQVVLTMLITEAGKRDPQALATRLLDCLSDDQKDTLYDGLREARLAILDHNIAQLAAGKQESPPRENQS